jgi:hypothetical protein
MSEQSTATASSEERKPKRRSPAMLPASLDPDALINTLQVRELMGGVTHVTVSRWLKDGKFPKPDAVIGSAYYWQRRTVVDHIKSMKGALEQQQSHPKGRRFASKAEA